MAILTIISGIPLFSTEGEATAWGASRGLSGFHTHNYNGEVGYMGGLDHSQALIYNPNILTEQETLTEDDIPINEQEENNINTSDSLPPTTSSSGGGGGGY